jgi:hypothetical protein
MKNKRYKITKVAYSWVLAVIVERHPKQNNINKKR